MSPTRALAVVVLLGIGVAEWIILRRWDATVPRPSSPPIATFSNAKLVTWRGTRELVRAESATASLDRRSGDFVLDHPHIRVAAGEATIEVERATGRLAPLTIETTGRTHLVDDAGSTVDLIDARYADDATVRTLKPSSVHASIDGLEVRYRARSATWDPVAGRITMNGVEASYSRADAGLVVQAERLEVDDLWQRARFANASWNGRSCWRLTLSRPHGGGIFDGGVECEH